MPFIKGNKLGRPFGIKNTIFPINKRNTFKVCVKCKLNKNISEFHKGNWKYGVRNICKVCRSMMISSSDEKLKIRNWNLKKNYNITVEFFDKLFEEQSFSCAICKSKNPKSNYGNFCIDHCHKTKKVRGILCQPCNTALGLFNDNIIKLQEAIIYLQKNAD